MKTYRVKRKCLWRGRLWQPGEVVELDGGVKPPEHFEAVKGLPEAPQPAESGQQPAASNKPAEAQPTESEKPEDNFFALKAKVRKLGIDVGNKDSKETVLAKYNEYKQMVAEAEKAGIEVPEGATRDEVLALIGG